MRSKDDPRAAAELFCGQHGITDENSIGLLEDALRDVMLSPPRRSPSSAWENEASPPLRPTSPTPSPSPSQSSQQQSQSSLVDNAARADEGEALQTWARKERNAKAERENAAVGRVTTAGPAGSDEQREHEKRREDPYRQEVAGTSRDGAAAQAATTISAGEQGASQARSTGIDVMEVARAMRAAATASQDSSDPASVVVDLIVNGTPAPLVFRFPPPSHRRKPAVRTNHDDGRDRCPDCDRNERRALGDVDGCGEGDERGGVGCEKGARCDRRGTESDGNCHDRSDGAGDETSTEVADGGSNDEREGRGGVGRPEGGRGGTADDKVGGCASSSGGEVVCYGSSSDKNKYNNNNNNNNKDNNDNYRRSDGPAFNQTRCDHRTENGTGGQTDSGLRAGLHGDDHNDDGFRGGGGTREGVPGTKKAEEEWTEKAQEERGGEDTKEDRERAIAAAAAAWCREFGTDRTEDISFVEAEIRKAVAASEEARAAAGGNTAAEMPEAETSPAEAAVAEAAGDGTVKTASTAASATKRGGHRHREIVGSTPSAAGSGTEEAMQQGEEEATGKTSTSAPGAEQTAGGGEGEGGGDAQARYERGHRGAGSSSSSSGSSRSDGGSGGGETSSSATHERRGKKGEKKGGAEEEHQERLTVSSVLAPDVERGTSIFWVQVEPSLPVVYVMAGYSALEISEQFCRTHGLGPSQVPLVAWKVLEVYPLQMDAARRVGTPLPANVTLGYAARQPEVQVAAFVILAGLLLLLLRRRLGESRSSRWWFLRARITPGRTAARGYLQRRNVGDVAATASSAFCRRFFQRWGRSKHRAEQLREETVEAANPPSTAPNGNTGIRPLVWLRNLGDHVPHSSLLRRLFRHAMGNAAAAGQALGGKAAEGTIAGGKAGRGGDGGLLAGSTRASGEGNRNENATGRVENRTTITTDSAATNAVRTVPPDDTNSSSSSSCSSRNKAIDDDNKTLWGGSFASLRLLRSWADALSFECRRMVGAILRKVVVVPLMRIFSGGGSGGTTDPETTSAEAIAAYPWPKKRAQPASTAKARSRKGLQSSPNGLGAKKNAPKVARKTQKGTSKGPESCTTPRAVEEEEAHGRTARECSGGGDGRAPFSAGRNDQRRSNDDDASKGKGMNEGVPAVATAVMGGIGGSGPPERTWASVLDGLSKDPLNRFSQVALLSNVGHILAKTDAFGIEAHEACDWTRLFKSKKADVTVGGERFLVLSRDDGSIIISNKALGTKMIGCKTRAGTVILGTYNDLSKSEARDRIAWLVEALASARVR